MRTPAKWLKAMKRRQPGIYWYRTWRHLNPTRSEWGYVGKSRHLTARDRDHAGKGAWGHDEKPWYDLVKYRRTLRLPWWLGWDWVTLSLETAMILVLKPRYNWQKNPWPGKVGPREQAAQRREREARPVDYRVKVALVRASYVALRVLGLVLIVTGGVGWWVTR